MAIISEKKNNFRFGYGNTQFRYAATYVIITAIVLLILNLYCSGISQRIFYQGKEVSLIEKCQLASDEIATLDVLNSTSVTAIVGQMESLKITRLIVTDQKGFALYDSAGQSAGTYTMFPEILQALSTDNSASDGHDVFSWNYQDGAMTSRAATPIVSYGTLVGCVYMTEYDTTQGSLIRSLQGTLLKITLYLEVVVILFSIGFSAAFSRRLRQIMSSMRIIRDGDYSHKVDIGGNDELTILGNEFNDLTDRLHKSEQKRSRFVSDASHELKTPLASIKLLSDSILQNDMDMETVQEFVRDIGNEAERLNRLAEKLLGMAKAEQSKETESEIILLKPTILRVSRMLEQTAKKGNVSFDFHLDADCPVLILEDDLYQIVFNLMENAIKYNLPGGTITVTLSRDEENAILKISDTGMGIPQEALEHIFERFYRVDKARSRKSGGSGLGLAIVRSLVERNRGEISVTSQLGQGSCFQVTFPNFDTEAAEI